LFAQGFFLINILSFHAATIIHFFLPILLFFSITLPMNSTANDVEYDYINEESINERLKCSICTMPFIEPVVTNCRIKRHIFCRQCIKEWIKRNPSCPSCRDTVVVKDLKLIAECYLLDSLNALQVKCKNCGQTGLERANFDEHRSKHCPKVITPCPLADLHCQWKGPLDQVDIHLNSCVFKPLGPFITQLKEQINELRRTNQQLEKRLKKTESKFRILKDYSSKN